MNDEEIRDPEEEMRDEGLAPDDNLGLDGEEKKKKDKDLIDDDTVSLDDEIEEELDLDEEDKMDDEYNQ